MKKASAICLLAACFASLLSPRAVAVEDGQVRYVGGTIPVLKEGVVGHLDTTSAAAMRFEYAGSVLEIPYGSIESFDYSREVTHHLGVLPAIAVGLSKSRKHQHFFRISFSDGGSAKQVAIFEVPKQMPPTLLAILRTRAPNVCKARVRTDCGTREGNPQPRPHNRDGSLARPIAAARS